LGDHDRHGLMPLYEAVVVEARKAGLAGATVFGGSMGFGANSIVHRAHLLRLSEDLPVVVEIVDEDERVRAFVPVVQALLKGGLITLEAVEVIHYRPAGERP
ncbi:MAG TPA: DUF190 domain-containing protein, partial [Deinococcales bacterium]|nr:DUF190 domain-containing protein [Deinococcales bacterium]